MLVDFQSIGKEDVSYSKDGALKHEPTKPTEKQEMTGGFGFFLFLLWAKPTFFPYRLIFKSPCTVLLE